jgi:hypothetical protein
MKKILTIVVVINLLLGAIGQITKFAIYIQDVKWTREYVAFSDNHVILSVPVTTPVVKAVEVEVGLPKVEAPTQDPVVLMREIEMERDNALCQAYSELPLVIREENGPRLREDYPVDIAIIRSWLENPLLFVEGSTKGERPEAAAAKAHYRQLVKEGKIKNPFTNDQLISIILTEAMWWKAQKGQNIINLNTVGDRGYSDHEEWAHGPFQISKRMREGIEIFKGFDLKSTDFLGDLELSLYAYIAWHEQWTVGKSFEQRMAMYNAGPTGAQPGHKYHGKGKRYAQKVNRFLAIVKTVPAAETEKVSIAQALIFYGPQDAVETLEEVQFSHSGGEKFELPSWDSDNDSTTIASNP